MTVFTLESTGAFACVRRVGVVLAHAIIFAGFGLAKVGPTGKSTRSVHALFSSAPTIVRLALVNIFVAIRAGPRGVARADILVTAAGCAFAMYTWTGAAWIRREFTIFAHVVTAADALVAIDSWIARALILTRRRNAGFAALVIHSSALNLYQKPTRTNAGVAVEFDEHSVAGALEFSCGKIPQRARKGEIKEPKRGVCPKGKRKGGMGGG